MELSDEDLEAIQLVRRVLEEQGPEADRDKWERVLELAGEIPPEPEDQTFWYDPQERIVYQRDDLQNPESRQNWWRTGAMTPESWAGLGSARRHLVQLVRADESKAPQVNLYPEVLTELLGAWEAQHREKCGGSVRLSRCKYADCMGYWQRLHNFGVRTTWESVGS